MSRRVRRLRSEIVSLVRNGTSSRPGIGGIWGEEPAAMTKRRALDLGVAGLHGPLVGETRFRLDHGGTPSRGETLDGIIGVDRSR